MKAIAYVTLFAIAVGPANAQVAHTNSSTVYHHRPKISFDEDCGLDNGKRPTDSCVEFVRYVIATLGTPFNPGSPNEFCIPSNVDVRIVTDSIHRALRKINRSCAGLGCEEVWVRMALHQTYPCER